MSYGASVARNAAWLVIATTAQKMITFVAFLFVARLLGKNDVGVYLYAISITSIFVTIADLGMTPVVIRAVAGEQEAGERTFSAAVLLKAALLPLALAGALGYGLVMGVDSRTFFTIVIACGVMSADTTHLVLYGVLRGKQNLRPEAFGMFVGQALTSVLAVGGAWVGFGPVGLAVALLAGSVWNVIWSALKVKQLGLTWLWPTRADVRFLVLQALPFGIAGIAVKIYSYVDSLFLNQYYGHGVVGLYGVAYKMTYAMQFLPLTFTAALYPSLAAAFAKKEETALRETFLGAVRLMAVVSFPLSALLSGLSGKIIPLAYGVAFVDAAPILRVLPWVLIPIFMDFPIGSLLNASHRAHLKTTAMVATMVLNVVLNAVLVPRYGGVGAAWAGVVSFWVLYALGVWFVRGTVPIRFLVGLTARALGAAMVVWVLTLWLASHVPFIVALGSACVASLAGAMVCGLAKWHDLAFLLTRIRRRGSIIEETV